MQGKASGNQLKNICKMKSNDSKYERIISTIRAIQPEMRHPEIINKRILEKIEMKRRGTSISDVVLDFFFGWIYIGWVRKSMVFAAMFFILLFIYQQAVIIRKVSELSGQRISNGSLFISGSTEGITGRINFFRLSGRKLQLEKKTYSKEDIDEMIRSVNNLQIRYQDLFDQIRDNPELKKYVETRLNEFGK
jgi:hypothetical protein